MAAESCDSDEIVDHLLSEYDVNVMPLPDVESEPHLLISKVRKHYMEYMIQLLSINYETNQRLLNKNIYLPSAIWRCAKHIEMKAAQTCMVMQLYRKNIVSVIQDLKKDTKKGKLYKKLYECLSKPAENEKKTQTVSENPKDCNCPCACGQFQKRRKRSISPKVSQDKKNITTDILNSFTEQYKIPVAINMNTEPLQALQTEVTNAEQLTQSITGAKILRQTNIVSPKANIRMSVEIQDSDELTLQLEKLFQGDPSDDDLFEGILCETVDSMPCDNHTKTLSTYDGNINKKQDTMIEDHAAQIKSLDERLATLAGLLVNTSESTTIQQKPDISKKRGNSSKWLCEEYFLKVHLFEMLDQIGETNRKELARIKEIFVDLFGNDSDDEGMVSPLDETPEFIISCKERIAPWVAKLLTPYYIKGRIKGKTLFKALAKHLIRLIYQCSRYPQEYEVKSFVSDFLANHKMIRCEADFKQFRIENI